MYRVRNEEVSRRVGLEREPTGTVDHRVGMVWTCGDIGLEQYRRSII